MDKACVSDSRSVLVSEESAVQFAAGGVEIRTVGDAEWDNLQSSSNVRIADVREISPDAEGGSLDIPVVTQPVNDVPHVGSSL